MSRQQQFPLGSRLTVEAMDRDPYPVYRQLRESEPVTWSRVFNMYLVTRYEDVQTVLRDTEAYITGTEDSIILDIFGEHMLTTEGAQHDLYKTPLLPTFRPGPIRKLMETAVQEHVLELIEGFAAAGEVDLRGAFASRLPIKTVLSLFGFPQSDEQALRGWYDALEKALSNFTRDEDIRIAGHRNVAEFHQYLQQHIEAKRHKPDRLLLDQMLNIRDPRPLTDEEIQRNVSIIFFGGISTVEALILNCVYALHQYPEVAKRLRANTGDIPRFLDEVVRWMGPVQSATRHVTRDVTLGEVNFKAGDTVNCMIAAANRDPAVFENPDFFDIDRPNLRRHLGFAIGGHHCLGSHLAKLEAAVAIEKLLGVLPGFTVDPIADTRVRGYEFRQPPALKVMWN